MNKETQFIMLVQTGALARLIAQPGDGTAPRSRAVSAIDTLEGAFECASRIPAETSPREAAEAYLRWNHGESQPEDRELLGKLFRDTEPE